MVTANKQLLSQHGEEVFDSAREHRVQLRFEGAVAGVVPAIRVMAESLAAAHRPGPRDRQRHDQLHPHRDDSHWGHVRRGPPGRAGLGYAEADPTEDVTGKDAAAKMAILARLAFNAAVRLDDVSCGDPADHAGRHRVRKGAGPVAEAGGLGRADRRRGRARVSGLPVRRAPAGLGERRLQRGDGRVARSHRITLSGPGQEVSRPRAPCSGTSSRR